MNGANNAAWSGAEQHQQHTDQDFGSLLAFDSLDGLDGFNVDFTLDYPPPGPSDSHDGSHQQLTAELAQTLDAQHLHGFYDFAMPHFSGAHMYRPRPHVPPTPNSAELHGDPAQYLQQLQTQSALFDHDFPMRTDDASFTPLVSPAVTPYDRPHMPDYTIAPGAYSFSPLTSPALTAQNYQQPHLQQNQHQHQYNTTSGSSTDASPLDVDMGLTQTEQAPRLRSNKRSAPVQPSAARGVSQSPIVKPNRRKAPASSIRASKAELAPAPAGLEVPRSSESSEFDSVSPERLSDMGPPPLPGSVTHSPAVFAQGGSGACPATPASLMRLQQSPSFAHVIDGQMALDDLMLPEPSLDKPSVSGLDTAVLVESTSTSTSTSFTSARKTPKLTPLSTPSAAVAQSGKPSPMIGAIASPTSPAFAQAAGKRIDGKIGRNSKKRGSVSSTLVSPAIRPKISPSIKPMTSEGGIASDAHTLLLASKSNYQNILDGTNVPGVVFPTSLSTNLTSKRTSHKLAEQGRRNRINSALTEMQALLPPPKAGSKEAADLKSPDLTATQSNASKAVKVERAIEYIKQLQKEVSEKDGLLSQKDRENEALRKELESLKKGEPVESADVPQQTSPGISDAQTPT